MKAGILRSALIASAVALCLTPLAGNSVANAESSLVSERANVRYFVYFDQPGVIEYDGHLPGLARTAPVRSGVKFDANRSEVVDYRAHLLGEQNRLLSELEQKIGRSLDVSYRYDILFSGVVIELTASEVTVVAGHPGVKKVEIVREYELATDRGPSFIGADTIWSGANTGGAGPYRGEGMVIGVLDTGVNQAHPSFANDASCGFSAQSPKLIAAKDCINSGTCTGPTPGDDNGHGSHTAGTAGGNTHIATGGALAGMELSGIAPCAALITYKVCPTNSCDGAAIQAAIQTALIDQVDALNYSISGGTNPWTLGDSDRGFLDLVDAGVFVAASAGNTNAQIPNPIGQVNHRGPWVMTVANSTHDRINKNRIDVAGGPQDVYSLKSSAPFNANVVATVADSQVLGNVLGCTADGGFPANSMSGRIALISRGTCTFEEKINNAVAAGAVAVIVYNSNLGQPPIAMGIGAATSVPSVMVSRADGLAISSHVTSNPASQATMHATTTVALEPAAGDILNAGSLRGPIAGGIEVTKPDITAPGTNIMAAVAGAPNAYDFLTGTSMSGPHVAGSGTLIKGLRPTWTVPEIKSAIMMTAFKEGQKDFVNGTPNNGLWDADDVGNGRADLTKAALAGLVMNETKANFLAAEGSVVNQRELNLPSVRNTDCTPSCSWTRTVRNTLSGASNWTVTGQNLTADFDIEVSPSSFSFNGDGIPAADTLFRNGFEEGEPAPETQVITITATPNTNLTGAVAFGDVVFTEMDGRSPDLHVTVSIKGNGGPTPPDIEVEPTSISGNAQVGGNPAVSLLTVSNIGGANLIWAEGNMPATPVVVWEQPVQGTSGIVSDFSIPLNAGAYTANDFVVNDQTELATIVAPGFDNSNTLAAQSAITWAIYADAAGVPAGDPETNPGAALWTYTSPVDGPGVDITGNTISLDLAEAGELVALQAGTYWLTVFPTYNNNLPAGTRWNWYQAAPVGVGSQLISPQIFGVMNWTATGAGGLGTAIEDTAFTITGTVAGTCGAPWLSIDPTGGVVAPAGSQGVDVTLDPTGLNAGVYETNLCIDSNDPDEPLVVVPVTFTVTGGGGITYQQGFENVADIFVNGGWFQQNNSEPLGPSTFAQGGVALSPGQSGGFAVVNFNSTTGTGTISNWMLTPVITFDNNTSLSFYTRAPAGSNFPDRLEVRVSSAGNSTNVGVGANAVGDFTTVLLTINPALTVGGYPENWTEFTLDNADGIPTTGSGRIAFRYFVTDGGPLGSNSDIIGFDTLTINAAAVDGQAPEEPAEDVAPADPLLSGARSE